MKELFARAKGVIAGGVNSPVRAFGAVGGEPVFVRRGEGACVFGEDGRRYVDYVGSWGAMILGHADARVVRAVEEVLPRGLSFGAPTTLETEMAEHLCAALPWLERVRMVNSGSEAVMSALRLARGVTGRDKVVKFEGCYHGHADGLLVKAGSGALTLGVPSSAGVPEDVARHTLTAIFNDLNSVEEIFAEWGGEVAAVVVEPVAGNMNCVPPRAGFLEGLRAICERAGSLLIMDEVMTGFRVGAQGAQGLYGVRGDITTLGKVIGGGLPVGALGGSEEVMRHLAPQGKVYQAGTLSGNPVAMAAGLATLRAVSEEGFFGRLEAATGRLVDGLVEAAGEHGVGLRANRVGGMFGLFFTEAEEVGCFADVEGCDGEGFVRFFRGMLERGVYFAPSAFEAGFVSAAHGEAEVAETIAAAREVFGGWR